MNFFYPQGWLPDWKCVYKTEDLKWLSIYKTQTEEILNCDILEILKKFAKLTFLLYTELLF